MMFDFNFPRKGIVHDHLSPLPTDSLCLSNSLLRQMIIVVNSNRITFPDRTGWLEPQLYGPYSPRPHPLQLLPQLFDLATALRTDFARLISETLS